VKFIYQEMNVDCLGTTLIRNFSKRLRAELPQSLQHLRIIERADRKILSYIGAAQVPPPPPESSSNIWLSKSEFYENGTNIIKTKWF
jgi:actin-related protein